MTLNKAPWAVDGARTSAASGRELARAATGGRSGVASPLDMRVLPLSPNGNGLRITSGTTAIENWYQSDPDQTYIVSNPSTHVVEASDMPPASPQLAYYLVCVVTGDPTFDQSDHPYMPSGLLDPAVALDFEYNRIVVVPCGANTTRFEDLGYNYPAYALARLEIPPNTTTITAGMIVDLRSLTVPRTSSDVIVTQPSPGNVMGGTSYTQWTDSLPIITIPKWATHISVMLTISGALHMDPEVQGAFRVQVGNAIYGPTTTFVFDDSTGASGGERVNLVTALSAPLGNLAGTSQGVVIEGYKDGAYAGYLQTYSGQTHIYDVRFFERI